MPITVSTGSSAALTTQLQVHNQIKTLCTLAGYPTPFQEYTAASPFLLVYEFANGSGTRSNTYQVFSTSSTFATQIQAFATWNTGTRTGTDASSILNLNSFFDTAFSYMCVSDSNSKVGFIIAYQAAIAIQPFYTGYVKAQNVISSLSVNSYNTTFFFTRNTASYNLITLWQLYGTGTKFGSGSVFSQISLYNTVDARAASLNGTDPSGKYSLAGPVLLKSGEVAVGTAPSELVYGPTFLAFPGDSAIVTSGVEEYRSLGCGLWVRSV